MEALQTMRIALNWPQIGRITMTSQFVKMTNSSSNFFWQFRLYFVKFSHWSKFHVNIIIGPRVFFIKDSLQFSFIKDWQKSGYRKYSQVFPNIWRLERAIDTKFGTNKMLLNYWMLQNFSVTALPFLSHYGKTKLGSKVTPLTKTRVKK